MRLLVWGAGGFCGFVDWLSFGFLNNNKKKNTISHSCVGLFWFARHWLIRVCWLIILVDIECMSVSLCVWKRECVWGWRKVLTKCRECYWLRFIFHLPPCWRPESTHWASPAAEPRKSSWASQRWCGHEAIGIWENLFADSMHFPADFRISTRNHTVDFDSASVSTFGMNAIHRLWCDMSVTCLDDFS